MLSTAPTRSIRRPAPQLAQRWEYNLDLQLRAAQMPLEVPDWLKPLQLRGRIAFVDQYLGHTATSFTEYRVILNYEVTWNGTRRYSELSSRA